ncbi:V-type ATPase subunit subunit G family protein [Deinococcus yavapaiensis]|uniref:(H+)-ATPase G subunit n=1 Tax=Deinococcus yavapaiensis KR-236 TaxID=694435 RepID=A0A318SII4_9DEIO|nr:V-type ATPase subunit subunit G family protein [Deinococcus yavapaiensis]PYE51182.1 (H+)-ATPase G subunit [Deinococcus yavapaiensis KR-236]
MDASSRILSELASRELALDQQIEAAKAEADREIEAARARAAHIEQEANAQLAEMQAEFEQVLAARTAEIRERAHVDAQREVQAATERSERKLEQAVVMILKAVLP